MCAKQDTNGQIDRGYIKEIARVSEDCNRITDAMDDWSVTGMIITEVRFRGPELTRDGYMAVVKAKDEAGNGFVAFRTGGSVREVLSKIGGDLAQGRLQMKEETPYDPDGAKARAKAARG
jgi:hypothetical protein